MDLLNQKLKNIKSFSKIGNSGQNQIYAGTKADVFTQLYEGHLQWKYRGLEFRTLGSWGHIDNADILSVAAGQTIGSENYGWYSEIGYDVMPLLIPASLQYLAPFFRVERYNTLAAVATGFDNSVGLDRWIYQAGLSYKPIPNIVVKADYRNIQDRKIAPLGIPTGDEFNLGFGFIY